MKIATILDQIDLGSIALPEFQRGYVWNRDQVRGLMDSLYRKHPVGSLLVWLTRTEHANARGDGSLAPGTVKLLLDGQQRITSLYGIMRGKPPQFFDGNAQAFTGLYFHLDDELFEFYAPLKMQDNPLWISVTELMQIGAGEAIKRLLSVPALQARLTVYINRLNAIDAIKDVDLHIEEVTGKDKTVDIVVNIFNRVNSGGTKLSKGDLALAKICAEWPDAREAMKARLEKWRKAGFYFRLEWLLRCINTILTGEAFFSALKDVDTATFKRGLQQAEEAVDTLLTLIGSRLGLDHDQVLGSRYSFPLLARYLVSRGGRLATAHERDQLLYALANLTFLTQDTNLLVSDREPTEYLNVYVPKHPGAVESHWMPMDRNLWKVEHYRDFLAARRALLAQAANTFLNCLLAGAVPERTLVPGGIASVEEERLIQYCQEWVVEQGLPRGEERYEVADPTNGELLAVLDVAWPQGLQEGYSQPVALLIDEVHEVEEAANRAGYRYFTDVEGFRSYVQREILAVDAGPV
jgi:Protein of unknown function DUF262